LLDWEEQCEEDGVLNRQKYALGVLEKSLVQPKLSIKEIRKLPGSILAKLIDEAMKLNSSPLEKKRGLPS